MTSAGLELSVRAAEKRDAGRGIARLPESARHELGVLSGDTVALAGERTAVAKVWPGGPGVPDGAVAIDADTRSNAGVKVGGVVRVSPIDVADGDRVTLEAPAELRSADVDPETVERALARELRDRPVRAGETVLVD